MKNIDKTLQDHLQLPDVEAIADAMREESRQGD